jgi:cysteine desulfurase/selenocysteine lyase
MAKDILSARQDFPVLGTQVNDRPLVYLDNAATTQKPQAVIDTLSDYYTRYNANIHRGNYTLAIEATNAHEAARAKVANYINAEHSHEVVFTRGATESINLVAYSFGERFVQAGDEIIVTQLEHHSNYVPWKLLCERRGAIFNVVPFDENGDLDLDVYKSLLNEKTRLVAVNHVSNSLGTVNPVKEIIQLSHDAGAVVLVDAAQSVQHIEHDVQALDADFYAFSGHKMYGPMGVGVLYGKEKWLDAMPPFLSGGEMIDVVTPEKITYNILPYKFEAGTPYVPGPIGLATAIDYLQSFDEQELHAYEDDLLKYGIERLKEIPGLKLYGNPKRRSSILPFNIEGVQHYDLGILLDARGIAVRTGQHCTQPIMDALKISGTVRASLALYNTREDIDALVNAIQRVLKILRK